MVVVVTPFFVVTVCVVVTGFPLTIRVVVEVEVEVMFPPNEEDEDDDEDDDDDENDDEDEDDHEVEVLLSENVEKPNDGVWEVNPKPVPLNGWFVKKLVNNGSFPKAFLKISSAVEK